jgi:hypothetical protein
MTLFFSNCPSNNIMHTYESNVFRYNTILIDCVFGNSKFVVPSTLTIDLGFASVNSQCLGDNKDIFMLFPQSCIRVWFFWEHKFAWWLQVLWKFWRSFFLILEFWNIILLVFIILRWSYESNVFRYNTILIDCVFGNSKFVVPSTLTIDLGFASGKFLEILNFWTLKLLFFFFYNL